jgi:pimeloyl-ACP methyl ester carboxylesterase
MRSRRFAHLPALTLAWGAAAHAPLAGAQSASSALTVQPCTVPGYTGPARCGTLRVWENRQTRSGRKIGIRFVVLPATGVARAREAVTFFSGGPGEAATGDAAFTAMELAPVRDTRDLLFADARGTGGSNPLPCNVSRPADPQSYMVEFFTERGVAGCAAELAARADVTQYTSAQAADDMEELRQALGYDTLDLYGVSYGTRAALVFLRRHPEHVRAALFHGAVPTDMRYPLTVARDAQLALDGVFDDCAHDAACHAAFPDPAADLRAALGRFASGPVEAQVLDATKGGMTAIRLPRDRFTEALRAMTYDASTSSLIPAVMHRAAQGDFGPAAEQELGWRMNVEGDSRGVYLAVTCPEDVDFIDTAQANRLAEGTYLGTWRVADQKAACAAWPHRPLDRSFMQPVRSSVPLLVTNGQWDPATARSHAEEVLRGFPNGRLVVIPSAGHGTSGLVGVMPCYGSVVSRFIRTANAKTVDASCIARVHRPPFPTSLPGGRAVSLDSAALARYAGRYATPGEPPVELRVLAGRLHVWFADGNAPLLALEGGTFRLVPAPQIFLTFREENGTVTTFEFRNGGSPPQTFTRTGPASPLPPPPPE